MKPYYTTDDGSIQVHHARWEDAGDTVLDDSVRLILTSPPYDDAREYEGTNAPVDFTGLAAFFLRVLMPGGTVAMVLDGAVNNGVQSITPYRVICEWASLPGWRLLQVLAYGRRGSPGGYAGRFRKDHEPLIVMVKDGATHVCEKRRIASKPKTDMANDIGRSRIRERNGRQRVFGTHPDGTPRSIEQISHAGSFWWYGMVGHGQDPSADTGHPATFAEAFAMDAIKVWSNPGDLVLDPFAGSETVGFACKTLGRKHIGFERVKKYCDISKRRLLCMAQPELFETP